MEGEAAHRCVNISCPTQLKEHIRHFASRGAMDMKVWEKKFPLSSLMPS